MEIDRNVWHFLLKSLSVCDVSQFLGISANEGKEWQEHGISEEEPEIWYPVHFSL